MYYGHYTQQGDYIGFYSQQVHGTAIPTPNIPLSEEQWLEACTGDYKVVNKVHTFSPTTISEQEQLDNTLQLIRGQRNELLTACDWTQLTDCPLSSSKKTEWKVYRQQLRDITNSSDITNIQFPSAPL